MKKPALRLALIMVVTIGAGLFCTYWLRSAKDYEAADAPPNLKNIAQRVSEKNREYRKSTFWWSTAFHGSLLLAAFLSAASGIILKVESAGANREKFKKDLAAIFAGSAAFLLTLSGTLNFNRKWESNRIAAYQSENLLYQISSSSSNDLPRVYQRLQEIVARQNEGILGQEPVPTNHRSEGSTATE
jgi:hypothetical protein